MIRLAVVFVYCMLLSVFAGCGGQNGKAAGQPGLQGGRGDFPPVMVGVWEIRTGKYANPKYPHRWGLKFAPDGTITKIRHIYGGHITVNEEGVYLDVHEEDTHLVVILGDCLAEYKPEAGVLDVKIITEYYEMKLTGGTLSGRMEDYFSGPISEDGKTWETKWRNYSWLDGAISPDKEVIDANAETLVFTKLQFE